jgi:hypothetical protein
LLRASQKLISNMNLLRRILGLAWMVMGPVAVFYLIKTGLREIAKNPIIETQVQWIVFIAVSIPIAIGLVVFGYFAMIGEYDIAPANS